MMEKHEYELYKCISNMDQEMLRKSLVNILKKDFSNVIATKEYIMAQGETPVALVAHLDTVFTYGKRRIYYDKEADVMWSPHGLGADDRAGVFAILQILRQGLRPTVIFTTDEELGCMGADKLTMDYMDAPWPIHYIIEVDRQGANDCVFYGCNNEVFEKYINDFGFVTHIGSYSDISAICPAWGIAGVNLSVGYINEHSLQETLHVKYLERTIDKIKEMLTQTNIPFFKYVPFNPPKGTSVGFSFDYITCDGCGEPEDPYMMIPVGKKHFCPECSLTKIDWCKKCGAPYIIGNKKKHKCKEEKDERGTEDNSASV